MFKLNNSIREHNNLAPLKPRTKSKLALPPDPLNTEVIMNAQKRKSLPAKKLSPKKVPSFSPNSAKQRKLNIDKRYEEFKKKTESKPNQAFDKFMAFAEAYLKKAEKK